jgi:hypothetical protein
MTILCLLCAIGSFALFGLATDPHHHKRFGKRLTPEPKRRLRSLAWVGVGLCLAIAIGAQGTVYGPVLWLGALSFGAATAFLILNLAPAGAHDKSRKLD